MNETKRYEVKRWRERMGAGGGEREKEPKNLGAKTDCRMTLA